MEMKRSLLTLRRVATYREHTDVPNIRIFHLPLPTDLGTNAGRRHDIRDPAKEEHASARKGECKALRRMIMLVWLVVREREKPVLVLSRFSLTSLDSPVETIEAPAEIQDRADVPLSGEEGQKRRREFCAGYTCTRIWERFKATYSRDVLVERALRECVLVERGAEQERVGGEREVKGREKEKREEDGRDGRERERERERERNGKR